MEKKYGKVNVDKRKLQEDKKPMPVYVKYGIVAAVVLVAIVAGLLIWFNIAGSYVATVDGQKISVGEFKYYLEIQKENMLYQAQAVDPNVNADTFWATEIEGEKAIDIVKKNALEGIRDVKIQLAKAKEAKVELTSEEKKSIDDGIKSSYITPEQFGGGNRIKANKYFMDNYEFSIDDIKKVQTENYTVQKYVAAEVEKLKVTEAEIKDNYEKHPDWYKENTQMRTGAEEAAWARHILIKADKDAAQDVKDAAKKKAQDLLDKLKGGADFATLAKENSEDSNAQYGGDYLFGKGQMVPEFENPTFSLNNGQLYDTLVETEYGFHIIKLEEKYAKDQPVSLKCATEYREYGTGFISYKLYQEKLGELKKDARYEIKYNDAVYGGIK